jgi:hypothetical protein
MKRRILAFLGAVVFMAVAASPAWADRGGTFPERPGNTFPEIPPGSHGLPYAQSCVQLAANPAFRPGGPVSQHMSDTASRIAEGLYSDSCIEGYKP